MIYNYRSLEGMSYLWSRVMFDRKRTMIMRGIIDDFA